MERRITICQITSQRIQHYVSSAATWEDLIKEYPEISDMAEGMKIQCKEHRKSITSGSYTLPSGDCSIYLTVEKTESGGKNEEEEVEEMIRDSVEGLVAAIKKLSGANDLPF